MQKYKCTFPEAKEMWKNKDQDAVNKKLIAQTDKLLDTRHLKEKVAAMHKLEHAWDPMDKSMEGYSKMGTAQQPSTATRPSQ